MKNITIGTDTEVFLVNTQTGKVTSAEGIIGGSKEEPLNITSLGEGFALQEDNVMAEFNIPATNDNEEFKSNIDKILNHINTNYTNFKALIVPSANFNPIDLLTEQANKFGCDPDFDAYLMQQNFPPDPIMFPDIRFAGGHVHIGLLDKLGVKSIDFIQDNPLQTVNPEILHVLGNVVKFMDLFVGLPSTILDEDDQRKNVYGTPGRFRLKPYGVEYRSLSNYWIKDGYLIDMVLNGTKKAVEHAFNHDTLIYHDEFFQEVNSLMKNNKKQNIIQFLNELNITVPTSEKVK
jgi:hypothetical protein